MNFSEVVKIQFPNRSLTIKHHELVVHVVPFVKRFRTIGLFNEQEVFIPISYKIKSKIIVVVCSPFQLILSTFALKNKKIKHFLGLIFSNSFHYVESVWKL